MDGRGKRHKIQVRGGTADLIDESYNASPASMRAAFDVLAANVPEKGGRRIAVLGDMLELGDASSALHAELAEPLREARIDLVFTVGSEMRALDDALAKSRRGAHAASAAEMAEPLPARLAAGDVVTVKGSFGSRMREIVARPSPVPCPGDARLGAPCFIIIRAARRPVRAVQSLPLFDLPLGRRGRDLAVRSFALGPRSSLGSGRSSAKASPSARRAGEPPASAKKGTPTMGGVLILLALTVSTCCGPISQRLCLGHAVRHRGVRRRRVLQRLQSSPAAPRTACPAG